MRPDAAGPRTWMLAVVAGWALSVLVLALAGLGGRVDPLPDDPALVQALPQLATAAPTRLGPLDGYAQLRDRPLFYRDRRPQPFFIGGNPDEAARGFDFVLSSVLITPRLRMAILQPTQGGESVRVREGGSPDSMPDWQLLEVQPRSASFIGPDGPRTLELRVFDGSGGAPPTALTAAPPVAAPPMGGRAAARASMPGANPAAGSAALPMPADQPASMADAVDPDAANPGAPSNEPSLSSEEQMDAIRQRIEARRAQLREQQDAPATPDQTR